MENIESCVEELTTADLVTMIKSSGVTPQLLNVASFIQQHAILSKHISSYLSDGTDGLIRFFVNKGVPAAVASQVTSQEWNKILQHFMKYKNNKNVCATTNNQRKRKNQATVEIEEKKAKATGVVGQTSDGVSGPSKRVCVANNTTSSTAAAAIASLAAFAHTKVAVPCDTKVSQLRSSLLSLTATNMEPNHKHKTIESQDSKKSQPTKLTRSKRSEQQRKVYLNSKRHKKHQESFNRMYKMLVKFKDEFGHCRPTRYMAATKGPNAKYPHLGEWVSRVREARRNIRLLAANKKPLSDKRISDEGIRRLDKLGFCWERGDKQKWRENFNAFLAFKRNHGHAYLQRVQRKKLGRWACSQRERKNAADMGIFMCTYNLIQSIKAVDKDNFLMRLATIFLIFFTDGSNGCFLSLQCDRYSTQK